jgi:type I restriction enzyme M protein
MQGIEKFESELWKIADDLRANSGLASNEYFMPILGVIFLRHATNQFYEAREVIEADKAAGRMPDRPLVEADFGRRRALMLPEAARYDVLLTKPKDGKLGAALTSAMEAVEAAFPPLAGQLPRDYGRFEDDLLDLRPIFHPVGSRASWLFEPQNLGDAMGRGALI